MSFECIINGGFSNCCHFSFKKKVRIRNFVVLGGFGIKLTINFILAGLNPCAMGASTLAAKVESRFGFMGFKANQELIQTGRFYK